MKTNLHVAFREMRRQGIIAHMNLSLCMSDGLDEIAKEIDHLLRTSRKARHHLKGYCFFHDQDTARLREGDDLYLCYGPIDLDPNPVVGWLAEEVASLICDCLATHGLVWEWNGEVNRRIKVLRSSIRTLGRRPGPRKSAKTEP